MSDPVEESMIVPPKPPPKRRGRKKVPRRKLLTRPKHGRRGLKVDSGNNLTKDVAGCIFPDEEEGNDFLMPKLEETDASSILQSETLGNTLTDIQDSSSSFVALDSAATLGSSTTSWPSSSLSTPGYTMSSSLLDAAVLKLEDVDDVPPLPDVDPPVELVGLAIDRLTALVPACWRLRGGKSGIHFLLISRKCPHAIQREVLVSFDGNVLVYAHCVLVPLSQDLFDLKSTPFAPLREDSLGQFCDFCLSILRQTFRYKACVGANVSDILSVCNEIDGGFIDWNPYQEESYVKTFRSNSCSRLVPAFKQKRCRHCSVLFWKMQKRKPFLLASSADPFTTNKHLTREQSKKKLEEQTKIIRRKDRQITYLKARFKKILESKGVKIDEEINAFLGTDTSTQSATLGND